jgi:hypothetical protein
LPTHFPASSMTHEWPWKGSTSILSVSMYMILLSLTVAGPCLLPSALFSAWLSPLFPLVCPTYTWSDKFLYSQQNFSGWHIHHPDDGGSTHIWNVSLFQWDYTALYPGRLYYHTCSMKTYCCKVKLFCYMSWRHVGRWNIAPTHSWCQHEMGVRSQHHGPAVLTPQWKDKCVYSLDKLLGGPQSLSGCRG